MQTSVRKGFALLINKVNRLENYLVFNLCDLLDSVLSTVTVAKESFSKITSMTENVRAAS